WIYEVLYDKHLDLTLVPEARGDLIVIKVQRTPYSFSQADLPGLLRITRMVAGSPTSATAIAATGTTVNATKVRAVVRLPQALDYYQRVVFAKFAYYRQLVQGLERTATEFRMTPREVKELAVAWFLDIFVKLPPPVPARFLVLPPERRR
ncbi:hypothetical protein HYV98_02060, partial [Candidatus Azambacteria bacterium]|nr:hypothetical protein [Candidatus Azambacteria bacterium]